MSDQIPTSLKGLRVRLVVGPEKSGPIERQAYAKLKKILGEHGQHLSEQTLALFRQSLNGLLLHGLRARQIEPAKSPRIRFKASDGRIYEAPSEVWAEVQKADPGARKYSGNFGKAGATEVTHWR